MKRSTDFFVLVAKLYVRPRPRWGGRVKFEDGCRLTVKFTMLGVRFLDVDFIAIKHPFSM